MMDAIVTIQVGSDQHDWETEPLSCTRRDHKHLMLQNADYRFAIVGCARDLIAYAESIINAVELAGIEETRS